MKNLRPYLIFPGTCREALQFYARCLDGEITMLQTCAEAPMGFPPEAAERIFHSQLMADRVDFMASDDMPGKELTSGTNFAMFLYLSEPDEQLRIFDALSSGGKVMMPLSEGFGMLEDRFGVRWMVALDRS